MFCRICSTKFNWRIDFLHPTSFLALLHVVLGRAMTSREAGAQLLSPSETLILGKLLRLIASGGSWCTLHSSVVCLLNSFIWLHSIVCPPLVICFVCSSSSLLLQYAFLKSNINKSVIWLLYRSVSFLWLFYQYQLTTIISCRSCQWLSIITPTPSPNYNRKGWFFDAPHLLV